VSIFDNIIGTVREQAKARITIRSNITAPIVIPDSGPAPDADPSAPPSLSQRIAGWIKPSVRVESNFGSYLFEPYGPPSDTAGNVFAGVVALGLLTLVALAGYGTYKLVQR
jgi:hypothetical protein